MNGFARQCVLDDYILNRLSDYFQNINVVPVQMFEVTGRVTIILQDSISTFKMCLVLKLFEIEKLTRIFFSFCSQ